MQPIVEAYFDKDTFSFSYLVYAKGSNSAAVIDPVLNYNPAAVSTSYTGIERILDRINSLKLNLEWILETHVHADHLTAAYWLKQKTGAQNGIGNGILKVQETFNQLFELVDENAAKAENFDRLFNHNDTISLGNLTIKVNHTPGHTPSCCTYVIGNAAFVGDTLFMPDFGTARCDFPGGDARQLYQSIQSTLSLPDDTRLFMCHDYMPGGRELAWETSVAEQKLNNIHIKTGISESEFVEMRTNRDKELAVPKLILPALQINIRAGRLPHAEASGSHFLKLPINKL